MSMPSWRIGWPHTNDWTWIIVKSVILVCMRDFYAIADVKHALFAHMASTVSVGNISGHASLRCAAPGLGPFEDKSPRHKPLP